MVHPNIEYAASQEVAEVACQYVMKPILRGFSDSRGSARLRVMSYNVASQGFIDRKLITHKASPIDWNTRSNAIKCEIHEYDPHILFLQELDSKRRCSFGAFLHDHGMEMKFHSNPQNLHGCAIAWKMRMFRCKSVLNFDYKDGDHSQLNSRNIGLLAELVSQVASERFIIGTTHLNFLEKAHYERCRQLVVMLKKLVVVTVQSEAKVVIGGDLNMATNDPGYQYMINKKVCQQGREKLQRSAECKLASYAVPLKNSKKSLEALYKACDELRPLVRTLNSCYREVCGQDPKFTTKTLDYVFASSSLAVCSVLQPLPKTALPKLIPSVGEENRGFASDHLPLVVDLR